MGRPKGSKDRFPREWNRLPPDRTPEEQAELIASGMLDSVGRIKSKRTYNREVIPGVTDKLGRIKSPRTYNREVIPGVTDSIGRVRKPTRTYNREVIPGVTDSIGRRRRQPGVLSTGMYVQIDGMDYRIKFDGTVHALEKVGE